MKDAAAVNATRWALYAQLCATGLPVECGTGGRTKYNRTRLGIPKSHWGDAACVGASTPEALDVAGAQPLGIRARGHGCRQRCRTDAHGFPTRHLARTKRHFGFQTGDIVRARGSFNLSGKDIHVKHVRLLHRVDGYDYDFSPSLELGEKPSLSPIQPNARRSGRSTSRGN